eukprot:6095220-Prymnesium_polylepis.1
MAVLQPRITTHTAKNKETTAAARAVMSPQSRQLTSSLSKYVPELTQSSQSGPKVGAAVAGGPVSVELAPPHLQRCPRMAPIAVQQLHREISTAFALACWKVVLSPVKVVGAKCAAIRTTRVGRRAVRMLVDLTATTEHPSRVQLIAVTADAQTIFREYFSIRTTGRLWWTDAIARGERQFYAWHGLPSVRPTAGCGATARIAAAAW